MIKKQNLIIIGIFIVVVFGFYLISCNNTPTDYITDTSNGDVLYVKVTVKGEVEREGEYKIPSYWTVGDLFKYVGVKNSSDLSSFDLTSLVIDGMVYDIKNVNLSNVNYNNKININTATKDMLLTIKGIGDSTAEKIISYRSKHPFNSIQEIKNVSGIGDVVYEKIKDFITV